METNADFSDSSSLFSSNTGSTGGGISLQGGSYILVNNNTTMNFSDNHAREGGAIYNYDLSPGVQKSSIDCFVKHENSSLYRKNWKASFNFLNNTSDGVAGNSIYSTVVYPCTQRTVEERVHLSTSFLFCINSYWYFGSDNCTSQIETQGSRYEVSNGTLSHFPGVGFNLSIKVFDDLDHDITKSVGYTSRIVQTDPVIAQVDPKYTRTSGNFIELTGKENSTVTLELQSIASRPHLLRVKVELLK